MSTYDNIMGYFPEGMKPREIQTVIFKQIADAIDSDYEYICLDAGTGIGKSAIAMTLANYFGTAYIVTVTKQLQDQYAEDFPITLIKGRNNFTCKVMNPEGGYSACDDGMCQVNDSRNYKCGHGLTLKPDESANRAFVDCEGKEWNWMAFQDSEHCTYWDQKSEAINSNITLMNYASYYPELNFIPFFGHRDLGIFDEAHNLEDQVMSQIAITISDKMLDRTFGKIPPRFDVAVPTIENKMYKSDNLDKWIEIIESLIIKCEDVGTLTDLPKKSQQKVDSLYLRLKKGLEEITNYHDEWIVDNDYKNSSVAIKPIDVSRYCKKYFFNHVDMKLLMSATIFQKKSFCRWHGLDEDEVAYIYAKCPFPKENRPIYIKPVGPMSYKYKEQTKPKTIPVLEKILDKHRYEKGVIHTHSHEFARYVTHTLNDPRIITYSYPDYVPYNERLSRDEAIEMYMESSEPTVLVAPSVDEGVNFSGELCTFQVIYKIPYLGLSDKQVKMRMQKDKEWYAYKTVISLVQAYGRGMRKHDDYCDTYILDSDIDSVLKDKWRKCVDFIPEYFTEAVQRKKTINAPKVSDILFKDGIPVDKRFGKTALDAFF